MPSDERRVTRGRVQMCRPKGVRISGDYLTPDGRSPWSKALRAAGLPDPSEPAVGGWVSGAGGTTVSEDRSGHLRAVPDAVEELEEPSPDPEA